MNRITFPATFLLTFFTLILLGCGVGPDADETCLSCDSSNACCRIDSLAMSRPEEAMDLIDSLNREGSMSDFRALLLKTKICYNPLQDDYAVIRYAKEALAMDTKERTDRNKVILLRLLGNSSYLSCEYEESLNAAIEGEKIAVGMDSLVAQGEFRFLMGECMLKLGQATAGYANMEYGIAAFSGAETLHAKSTLSHLLGEEMNFMIDDGRLKDAFETGQRRERLLEETAGKFGMSEFIDQQYGYLYGKMAYIAKKIGEEKLSKEYAERFFSTGFSKDRNGKLRILEYCLEDGQYQKALQIIGDTDFPSTGDSLSYDAQYYLSLKAEAMRGSGDYEQAYHLLRRASEISGILEKKLDKEMAMRVAANYRTHEAELKAVESQAREARYLMYVIVFLTLCVALALAFFLYYNKTRSIVDKSRLIEMGRTDTEKYIRLLQSAQARIRELEPKEDAVKSKSSEADSWQLFLKLEDLMDNEKIFLDKTITRADILDILGIGKNRLGKMFQDIGGDLNLPSYINGKRLNHALGVIAEHPDYTVNEIAEASGFANSRNFHLLFKKRFGITPNQYKNGK